MQKHIIGMYNITLSVEDSSNCSSLLSKEVILNSCDIEILNLITHNGDGKNDVFEIENIKPNTQIEIYNRWGEMIYDSEDYKNDFNGKDLSDGIYYYHIIDSEESSSGWFILIR